uniref:Uncharacterized protein n=1 Tax=Rhizophora mucronata TaxID=61149 RepID=A0A2P2MYA7_RHIMU
MLTLGIKYMHQELLTLMYVVSLAALFPCRLNQTTCLCKPYS